MTIDSQLLNRVINDQRREFDGLLVEIDRQLDIAIHVKSTSEASVITGVRRCGKSTLLKQIAKTLAPDSNLLYLSFDDPRLVTFESADFERLYEDWLSRPERIHGGLDFLIFDEIQLIEGWERWVNYLNKLTNTKLFVTGSNAQLLSSELSTLLTGRHIDLHVTPFSFAEIAQAELGASSKLDGYDLTGHEARAKSRHLLDKYLNVGGFPRVWLDQRTSLLTRYFADIVQRDILYRHRRIKKSYIEDLGSILASESTRLFNRSKIAKLLGLKDPVTVTKYVKSFLDTFLFEELRGFSPSVRNQLRSLSKFYCCDHAMARENGFRSALQSGAQLESMVFNELRRRSNADIFYWHSKKDYEVDFLMVDRRKPTIAVQVCETIADAETREREMRALNAARAELDVEECWLITKDDQSSFSTKSIKVVSFIDFALKPRKFI